ncbi:MAG TPA: hypothetical protein VKB38_19065 [Terracidiphilus sp.]|nr:hypothetical protein [Terracidiphilus sp.]
MNRYRTKIIFSFALIFSTGSYSQTKAPSNDVCAVADHFQDFIGKRVAFRASVKSDGIERTILVNVNGDWCSHAIVPVENPKDPHSKEAASKLAQAIFTGRPGTLDKRVTGVFGGVISQGKPEDYMMAPGLRVAVLTLDSVDDLHIESISVGK